MRVDRAVSRAAAAWASVTTKRPHKSDHFSPFDQQIHTPNDPDPMTDGV